MKLYCERDALLGDVQLAAAPPRPARDIKPILKNIKAVAGDGPLHPDGHRPGAGHPPGRAQRPRSTSPARRSCRPPSSSSILRESRDEQLTIEADAERLRRHAATSIEFEMPSEDPAQFPDFPTFTEDKLPRDHGRRAARDDPPHRLRRRRRRTAVLA